jgi:prepilin-type N-terminal cleavage/methylation domain-containing protein
MLHNHLEAVRKARKSEGGFTLIELLIVIVILGVLAGIVVFSVRGITDRGEASACKAEVKTVAVAEEAYYASPVGAGSYGTLAQLQTGGFLRAGTPKYVASASAADGSLTLVGTPPAGCTAG